LATRTASPFKRYEVRGFGGGINKAVNSFARRDDELRDANNVQFGFLGSFLPRPGVDRYDLSGDHLGAGRQFPILGMHRYNKNDGTREIIIQGDRYIYSDNNTMAFSDLTNLNTSDDGFVRFAQWQDSLFITSRNDDLRVYNKGQTTEVITPSLTGGVDSSVHAFSAAAGTVFGGFKAADFVHYRFTFDIFTGNDFLAETYPLNYVPNDFTLESAFMQIPATASDDKTIEIKKNKTSSGGTVHDQASFSYPIKFINVYRRKQPSDLTTNTVGDTSDELRFDFFYVGSIDADKYNDAADGDVVFVDTGNDALGKQINHTMLIPPPRPLFVAAHKNRMWYASPGDMTLQKANESNASDFFNPVAFEGNEYRVYISDLGFPLNVRATNFVSIGRFDGEEITGMFSYRNRMMIVTKENSTWGIFGGDDEALTSTGTSTGFLNISVDAIDDSVGCIAPQTIAQGEGGAMWLSNRGVVFLNGNRIVPLRSKLIDPILEDLFDNRRPNAAGYYSNHDRKYWLFISDATLDGSKNRRALEYDFFTDTWTQHKYPSGIGFSNFIQVQRGDEQGSVLGAVESGNIVASGAVGTFDGTYYDLLSTNEIGWDATTKYFDCNEPDRVKVFRAIIVRTTATQTITVSYDVDEANSFTAITDTIGPSGHTWDEDNLSWLGTAPTDHVWSGVLAGETVRRIPQNVRGRRIAFKFSGTATIPGTEIQGITILYTTEDRLDVT
jgi:hypothetical protein